MDFLFQEDLQCDIFWCDPSVLPPTNRSAFSPYTASPASNPYWRPSHDQGFKPNPENNMNKRMIEFLRRSWAEPSQTQEFRHERGFRHMMNERMRRERQKHSYSGLLSVLPHGTKVGRANLCRVWVKLSGTRRRFKKRIHIPVQNDKNSIVQTACMRIKELVKYKQELERQNRELKSGLNEKRGDHTAGGTTITVKIANPTSGVDTALEVLKCLNNMELKAKVIQMQCSADELFALIEVQDEIEAASVEKVIQGRLLEAEGKLLLHSSYDGNMDWLG